MEKIQTTISCNECGADYMIIHFQKDIIEHCPMCGYDIEEPEEDDGEFEENFLAEYDYE